MVNKLSCITFSSAWCSAQLFQLSPTPAGPAQPSCQPSWPTLSQGARASWVVLREKEDEERRVRQEQKLKQKEGDTHRIRQQQALRGKEDREQHNQEERRKKDSGCSWGNDNSGHDEGHGGDQDEPESDGENEERFESAQGDKGKGKEREYVNANPSTSRAEEIWMAENIDLLQEVSTLLKKLLGVMRLPLHTILKKLDLVLTYSRENSWNIFKQYIKEAKGAAGSGYRDFFRIVQCYCHGPECIAKGDGTWELQKQQWRDALIWMGDDELLPLDALDTETLVYFNKVLKHQQDLATNIRNNGPVDILTLVYTSEPGIWGSSQFIAGDPALTEFLNMTDGDAQAFINNFITVTEMFKLGATSPEDMSFAQFTGILTSNKCPSPPGFPLPKKTSKHQLPPQMKVKAERVPIGVECISNFRGLVDRYRANKKDIPQEVALIKIRPDRAVCHMIIRGCLADKLNQAKPPPGIWRLNFCNQLITYKLVFYCPSKITLEVGTDAWDPNKWTTTKTETLLQYFRDGRIRMERWTEDNANLLLSDPRYKTIPIVISSTKPKNTHVTVNDTLDVTLNGASSAGEAVIGRSNKPLEIACKRSELRRDITALYRAPTIKNSSMLNRFMGQHNTADGQNHGSAEGEDEEEEDEEEEQQQQQQQQQKEQKEQKGQKGQGEQEEQGD
ncbi:hypothetical protein FA13DRAFT_1716095 [Coprinellus micaceus]|uniref:Uncharacterized protein n=1 Tax=Coprinellus micaceus TaxID=71717 RepID=A0A4Y7SKF6_COPMI|nr:hypothetical protein FA13DRAFT_1716095 [Coprinellus micaceus]